MTERPVEEEVRELAEQIVAGPDDVAELAADAARLYRRERLVALGLIAVESLVDGGTAEVDETDPRLAGPRTRLRDRLRELLAWARSTGRM